MMEVRTDYDVGCYIGGSFCCDCTCVTLNNGGGVDREKVVVVVIMEVLTIDISNNWMVVADVSIMVVVVME